ncbi:MAG: hypothetical protein ACFFDN_21110 [Candidatus Hodarchaeota archaeon]
MGLIYSIEFYLNRLTGYYYTGDPSGLLTPILAFSILGVTALSIVKLFKKYKETKEKSTLSWAFSLLFIELALTFIIIENISYTVLGQPDFGRIISLIAISCIICVIINLNNFALSMTYPTHKNKLLIIVGVLGIISIFLVIYANILGPPYAEIRGFILTYDFRISYFILAFVIPNFFIGPIIFFYFASKVREENRPKSNLSLWMGIGLTCFGFGYVSTFIPILAISLSFFLATTIIMYICFSMPEWFKSRIGWVS